LQEGGSELVRIDYAYETEKEEESGAVYLDPERNWGIRRVDVVSQDKKQSPNNEPYPPYHLKSEVLYQEFAGHIFFPKRMEFFGETPKPDIYEHVVLQLSQIDLGDAPAEMFKMSAYGLPDIPLKAVREPSILSLSSPLFWGSLVTAVLSFALLRLMRTRSAKTSNSRAS